MRRLALALVLVLSACAVKGYDLGWRKQGALADMLGAPLDGLADCTVAPAAPAPSGVCAALSGSLSDLARDLPPVVDAPVVLGARCRGTRCTYANVYERRDIGAALVVPVYKRIVLREARIGFARSVEGWRVEMLTIRDTLPPDYGPVRIGGRPATN